ncbi:MAG: transcriptional repressor [Planctomycetota bacterium]
MTQETRELFIDRGLRWTRQRADVYAALAMTKSHPTAEQLHDLVDEQTPGISRATVYNTLEALCDVGLARKIDCAGGCARFDADMRDHLHVHTEAGDVLDVPTDLSAEVVDAIPSEIVRRVEAQLGVRIDRVDVQFVARS